MKITLFSIILLFSINGFAVNWKKLTEYKSGSSFYEEAKKSYAIVTTTDARPFGCFIITKGVIKPDGSVWVLDK